jgi:Carboxypeptidase regulatory-like domain/TonB-dependent Receptor Plug Domain/Outer membrane protein beta-barrel family
MRHVVARILVRYLFIGIGVTTFMIHRVCAAVALALALLCSPVLAQGTASTTLTGRVLETSAGLAVRGATVELRHNQTLVATVKTAVDGSFSFDNVAPGDYSLLISGNGYQTSLIPVLHVEPGQTQIELQTALTPALAGLKQIAVVSTSASSALATTTTINENLAPSVLQDQNYIRAGDALGTLPFVTSETSNTVGDDENIQLRGFDASEDVALIDGHPVGPLGACPASNNQISSPCPYNSNGSLFDYQLAQFWGLSNISVILGSGATGLYGVPTLAGAVDFETLNPTPTDHAAFMQGYGDLSHTMTGLQFTGTAGKLGYAGAYAIEGSDGELNGPIVQTSMLSGADFNKALGGKDAQLCGDTGSGSPSFDLYGKYLPPSLAGADVDACTIDVGSNYLNKNVLAKLTYQLDSKTSVLVSFYDASSYANGVGNGQQYYTPYGEMLAQANSVLAQSAPGCTLSKSAKTCNNFVLQSGPNSGKSTNCSSTTIAVLDDSAGGYSCYTAPQFASAFSGPYDKGPGGYHIDGMQDYHARITRRIGAGTLTLDGYVDNYGEFNDKPDEDDFLAAEQDMFLTHGALISDEYAGQKNDLSFGVSFQHQMHFTNQWAVNLPSTNGGPCFGDCYLAFPFGDTSYFVHDAYQANDHFSVFTDLTLDNSKVSSTDSFDPRLSFVYRPNSSNVFRITGGAASISPDPVLYTGGVFPPTGLALLYNEPQGGIITDLPTSGAACDSPVPVLQGSNASVKPEQADDLEVALAHRFENQATVEIDAYNTIETNPIISGVVPLTSLPAGELTAFNAANPGYLAAAEATLTGPGGCGTGPYALGALVPTNAGQAQYRGINVSTKVPLTRQLEIDGNYTVQTSYYWGLSDQVLLTNAGYINGQQFYGIAPHTATLGLGYDSLPGAWTARVSGYYVGNNNSYYRPAFWYANANLSKTVGPITLNFGVSNLFNNDSGVYQLLNVGTPIPQNAFTPGTSPNNELTLLPRQIWMTTTIHI